MSSIISLLSKISTVGILLVGLFTWVTLPQVFALMENPLARWLCAALYVLFWPDFLCSAFLTSSEMKNRKSLYVAGGVAFLAVSAGCLYDHFWPSLTQVRGRGWVPDYPGLQWTATAALLLGYVVATRRINTLRPKSENDYRG